jgi:hypothetical protein
MSPGLHGCCAAVSTIARDVALVEGARAVARDRAQRLRIGRVAQDRADGQHLAVGVVQIRAQTRLRNVALHPRELVQAGRHRESNLGKRDRGLEQPCPRELAVLAMRGLEQANDAGNADRLASDGVVKLEGRAVFQEAVGCGGGGRRLAAVVRRQPMRARVVHEHEAAAANAGRLRLDETEHELNRDRCVDCAAALRQHAVARIRRERIRRCDHPMARVNRLPVDPDRGVLRHNRAHLSQRDRGSEQHRGDQRADQDHGTVHSRIMP